MFVALFHPFTVAFGMMIAKHLTSERENHCRYTDASDFLTPTPFLAKNSIFSVPLKGKNKAQIQMTQQAISLTLREKSNSINLTPFGEERPLIPIVREARKHTGKGGAMHVSPPPLHHHTVR